MSFIIAVILSYSAASLSVIIAVILGYLLGSIPFGLVLTKYAGLGDIRDIGSGNIGATNVLRTGNRKLAALTLFLDGFKGTVAVLLVGTMIPGAGALAGLSALLGHIFPVWLQFKGGKGVATAVGVLTALSWPMGLAAMLIWSAVAYFSRYSSVAAIVAIGLMPLYAIAFWRLDLLWIAIAMPVIVIARHHENIRRLIAGTEAKIGIKKTSPPVE